MPLKNLNRKKALKTIILENFGDYIGPSLADGGHIEHNQHDRNLILFKNIAMVEIQPLNNKSQLLSSFFLVLVDFTKFD